MRITLALALLAWGYGSAGGPARPPSGSGPPTFAVAGGQLRWHDATRTLTIGKRAGGFPGMLARRTFQLLLVTPSRAVPFSFAPKPDKSLTYAGDAISVRF